MPDDSPRTRSGESRPGGSRSPGLLTRLEDGFEGFLALARLMVLVPVIVLVLAAAGIFVYAAIVFFASMPGLFEHPVPVGHKLSVFVVEIDLFLIGATLIIAAFGFYELFISKIGDGPGRGRLPAWLEMRDLNDLKARVASMLILVAAVTFVDQVLAHNASVGIFYLGVAVALVIGALIAFLRFGSDAERGPRS
jgi:uncharacterized membrane protein YqhA